MWGRRSIRRLRASLFGLRGSTIAHVTHWKAGSQWVYRILDELAPERVVTPEVDGAHWRPPLRAGAIYPTIYLGRDAFDAVAGAAEARAFVVVRDLRDTLVSWYYSLRESHVVDSPIVAESRAALRPLDEPQGLLWTLEHVLPRSAHVQASWLGAPAPIVRYEDLLERDVEVLEPILLGHAGIRATRRRFRDVVEAHRFERLSGGRRPGEEDVSHHYRKGIAGDWRARFTPAVTAAFKARYGDLLVATGYEKDTAW